MKDYTVGNKSETINKNLVKELNCLLSDEYVLFTKTLKFHWNLRGKQFLSLHNFFGDQYNTLLVKMDDLAERIRTVDAFPVGTLDEIDSKTQISNIRQSEISESQMLKSLTESHHTITDNIKDLLSRDSVFKEDPGTEDFLVGLLQYHEKQIWMLKSQLS